MTDDAKNLLRECLQYLYESAPAEVYDRITAHLAADDVVTVPREVITLIRLVDEYCNALDNEDMDVGGYRPSVEIIGEIGPAVDDCMHLLAAPPTSNGKEG